VLIRFKFTERKGNMGTVKLTSGKMAARSAGLALSLVAAAEVVWSPRAGVNAVVSSLCAVGGERRCA